MRSCLPPISDREPLEWILREQRTAFPGYRHADASKLETGDRIFLYTTRGCFRNPTRDRGRVIGLARLQAIARDLEQPVVFGEREYSIGLPLEIELLAPRGHGVELAPLVSTMSSFPNKSAWSAYM